MEVDGFLDLERGAARGLKLRRAPIELDGFRVEHVRLDTAEPYEFRSGGTKHYVALHDLMLREGELHVDGLPPVSGLDLRGTLTYVPGGRSISGWAAPVDRSNSFTVLQFDPAAVSQALERRFRERAPAALIYSHDPALVQTMTKLRRTATAEQPDLLYTEALCLTVALELFGAVEVARAGRLSAQQMRRLTNYIDANLSGSLTLGELAKVAGLSRSHFSRRFTVSFGRGPHQFVRERRIARAEELLRSSARHLDEIAIITGFGSPASFRRNFKRLTGRTPVAYRNDD